MPRSSSRAPADDICATDRDRWNKKYREAPPSTWTVPDPFLPCAFSEYISPAFPRGGSALDLAGGAGRHSLWLAKQGWEVTLIDLSDTGVEQARQSAGPLASRIHFVVDDLTHFKAAQTRFDLVITFFYLDRNVFPEIVKSLKPGGLLVCKTRVFLPGNLAKATTPRSPKGPMYLLKPGELPVLASPLQLVHYREVDGEKTTAELIARKQLQEGANYRKADRKKADRNKK